jgi:hypothetical protein
MSGNTSASGGFLSPGVSPATQEDPALTIFLQKIVVGITGLTDTLVRRRWLPTPPNQPAADVDWCAIGIQTRRAEGGTPYVGHDPADGGSDVLSRNEVLEILATFYGPNSAALADRLTDGLWIAQNRETLLLNECGLVDVDDVTTLSELVNNQWILRNDLVFTIRRRRLRRFQVLNLEAAPVIITTDTASNS